MKYAPILTMIILAACATDGPKQRWDKDGGGTSSGFASDNDSCGAEASRRAPSAIADQSPAPAVAPRNTMNTPPRQDTNPVRQRAYMECMADRGWRVVTD
jgi:hypothetical protein